MVNISNINLLTAFSIIEKFYWKIVLVNQTNDTYIPIKDITNEKYRSQSFKNMWYKICEKYVDEEYTEKFLNFMQSNKNENYMVYERKVKDTKAWMLIEKYKIDNDNFLYCTRAVDQELMTLIFNKKRYEDLAYRDCISGFKNLAAYRKFISSDDSKNSKIILINLKDDTKFKDKEYYKVLDSYIKFSKILRQLLNGYEIYTGPSNYFMVTYDKDKNSIIPFFDNLKNKLYDEHGYVIDWTYIR